MTKKPKAPSLKLVQPDVTSSLAPDTLGKPGNPWQSHHGRISDRRLWRRCHAGAGLPCGRVCGAIAQDGPVISTKQGLKEHALLRHEMAARSFVVRTLRRLGLDVERSGRPGRPAASRNAITPLDGQLDSLPRSKITRRLGPMPRLAQANKRRHVQGPTEARRTSWVEHWVETRGGKHPSPYQ
jgi:hypothetical protein